LNGAGRDTKIRWLLIFWIFLISAAAYIDRVNLSIAGQAIAKDSRLTDIQLGYVFSAFVLGTRCFKRPQECWRIASVPAALWRLLLSGGLCSRP
jgi:ACS family glucarate transporter-like MFS transporter